MAIALLTMIAASFPATAGARGLNRRSDHAALGAYNRYLGSLIARSAIGSHRDDLFLNNVSSGCLGYLSPFASQISTSASHDLGVEVGADVTIRFTSADGKPLRRLTSRLVQIRWTGRRATDAVANFILAEHELLRLRTSRLCADAIHLGFHPKHVSSQTTRFNARFARLTATVAQALSNFIAVLQKHEQRGDRRLIASIDHRVATYQSLASSIESAHEATLIQDLGLHALS